MTEFKFTEEQSFALTQLDGEHDYYALKGYAGTGKTTVITHWVKQMRKEPEDAPRFWRAPKIVLTAPTNKAAGVLKEKAEELKLPVDVSTIHSLLGLKMKWEKDEQVLVEDRQGEDKFAEYDYVVIDEGSMLGEEILRFVCRAQKRTGNSVIFMGDPCQLPPIGERESRCFNAPAQTELKQSWTWGYISAIPFSHQLRIIRASSSSLSITSILFTCRSRRTRIQFYLPSLMLVKGIFVTLPGRTRWSTLGTIRYVTGFTASIEKTGFGESLLLQRPRSSTPTKTE